MAKRHRKPARPSSWDVALMEADREGRGWMFSDLADEARVSLSTITRFIQGEVQTPRVAKKIAIALGHPLERYHRPLVVADQRDDASPQPVKRPAPRRPQALNESAVSTTGR